MGIWPPSKRARSLAPERDPAPLWPRPEVLPMPEPWPRPTRLRGLRLLGAGLSVCSPKSVIDLHQVAHAMQHPARLGGVLDVDRVADLAQAQRFQRPALLRVGPVRALDLCHLHGVATSSSVGVSVAGASSASVGAPSRVSVAALSPPRPRTWSMERPRSFATSSGVRRDCSPATVALTRLIGFCVPSDLLRMSWMPASSSTARTPPPAMTQVPGEAGFRKTRPEPKTPVVWWVIVEPWRGTRK